MEMSDCCNLVLEKVPSPCGSVDSGVGLSPLALAGNDQLFPFPLSTEHQESSLNDADNISDVLYPSLKVVSSDLSVGGELTFRKVFENKFDYKEIDVCSKQYSNQKFSGSVSPNLTSSVNNMSSMDDMSYTSNYPET